MAIKRLRNVAAGLLSSFVSRNNDVEGYWAPGLLYTAASAAGSSAILLDLLGAEAMPSAPAAVTAARNDREFLRRALRREGIAIDQVVQAQVELRFDTPARPMSGHYCSGGEPFDCTVLLRLAGGAVAKRDEHGRCRRHDPSSFARSARAPG